MVVLAKCGNDGTDRRIQEPATPLPFQVFVVLIGLPLPPAHSHCTCARVSTFVFQDKQLRFHIWKRDLPPAPALSLYHPLEVAVDAQRWRAEARSYAYVTQVDDARIITLTKAC